MRILMLMLQPIGDTLFATPALHALREHYPDAHITAGVYPTNAGILRSNPDLDDIVYWPTRQSWRGPESFLELFADLRRERFDVTVGFSPYARWISMLAGVPRHIDMQLPPLWWLLPSVGKEWRKKHAVEHYADVVGRLDIRVTDKRLRFTPTGEEREQASALLRSYDVRPGELLVGIHPGGEGLWGRKRWDAVRFARVATHLADNMGARIMVMGGEADTRLAARMIAHTSAPVINATGQTTLGETAALLSHCTLFIGNDSSPLHIAAGVGTPVVGIYGVTDPRSYHPWVPGGKPGVDYAVVRAHTWCACRFSLIGGTSFPVWGLCLVCPGLSSIRPEQVIAAATRLIKARARD